MILINLTLSFTDKLQTESISWITSTYLPLVQACPLIKETYLCKIETDSNIEDCFALQIKFESLQDYQTYCTKYEFDFTHALHLKFQNNFGIFKTILKQIS